MVFVSSLTKLHSGLAWKTTDIGVNGKDLQKNCKIDIKSLKGIDFIEVLDNVTVEWE